MKRYMIYIVDGSAGQESVCNAGDIGDMSLGQEEPLEKEMAPPPPPQYSCLKIPWTEEPGEPMGLQRVVHD